MSEPFGKGNPVAFELPLIYVAAKSFMPSEILSLTEPSKGVQVFTNQEAAEEERKRIAAENKGVGVVAAFALVPVRLPGQE